MNEVLMLKILQKDFPHFSVQHDKCCTQHLIDPLIQMGDYIHSIALLIIGSTVMDECLHNVSMDSRRDNMSCSNISKKVSLLYQPLTQYCSPVFCRRKNSVSPNHCCTVNLLISCFRRTRLKENGLQY